MAIERGRETTKDNSVIELRVTVQRRSPKASEALKRDFKDTENSEVEV